jgi:hypothetical protein
VSASLDEMDRDIENHPPSRTVKTRAQRGGNLDPASTSSVVQDKLELKSQASGVDTDNDMGLPRIDDSGDDDDPPAMPHIIAKELTSDDNNDNNADDLFSLWRPR